MPQNKSVIEQIQEGEDSFSRLTEATIDGSVIYWNGKVLEANWAFTRLFG